MSRTLRGSGNISTCQTRITPTQLIASIQNSTTRTYSLRHTLRKNACLQSSGLIISCYNSLQVSFDVFDLAYFIPFDREA